MGDDFQRYVEYLQSTMLAEGWEAIFDYSYSKEQRGKSFEKALKNLGEQGFSSEESLVHNFERQAAAFQPSTRYEFPDTFQIFGPILKRTKETAEKTGIKLQRPVQLATSTDIGPSPLARPSNGSHILFIGFGTSIFCNYWAKAYTAVVNAIAQHDPRTRVIKPDDLNATLSANPTVLFLIARFALYYALHGTLIGFGKVEQPREFILGRSLLLDAMEMFVVSHEFGHFVAEEQCSDAQGTLTAEKCRELEIFCDKAGVALSRNAEDNFFAFAGIGALAMFRAIQLCEASREVVIEVTNIRVKTNHSQNGHPSIEERINNVKKHIFETTVDDQLEQVRRFMEEYDTIIKSVNDIALVVLNQAIRNLKRDSK